MKCLSVLALRMGLLLALAAIASPVARAQISSPAFDPNCYFPRIGVPGEIDTIYGGYVGQELGGGLINIGPSPENPGGAGRLMFGGLQKNPFALSAVDCGANFDSHHLSVSQFKGLHPANKYLLGHFRSRSYADLIQLDSLGNYANPTIFFADDKGLYDTSRYSHYYFKHSDWISGVSNTTPYHGYLTSDTAEDLVAVCYHHTDFARDSGFYVLFTGGSYLQNASKAIISGEAAFYDTAHVYDSHYPGAPQYSYSADFRGTGHTDCIAPNGHGTLFFYKNDPPFSISHFARSMREDTLLSAETENRIAHGSPWGYGGLNIRALHKPSGDSSFDLILPIVLNNTTSYLQGQLRIFRGGPDFGSHRLTIDSAYTLHYPTALDSNGFATAGWKGLTNCGDMTGTGRPVLGLGGIDFLTGLSAFYVLGDAIDEKVDMFYCGPGIGGPIDTCTIDGDGLQDIAQGDEAYSSLPPPKSNDEGTVRFIHGSKKIPVRLNRVEVRKTNPALEGAVTVSPNPCSRFTVVTWESSCSGEVHLTLRDLLGKTVYEETRPTTGDLECFRLDLPPLASGEYFLELQQEPCSQIAKIVVKH